MVLYKVIEKTGCLPLVFASKSTGISGLFYKLKPKDFFDDMV
jgi:hypothetical protein